VSFAGAAPAIRIADGTQAPGRILVSDANGNGVCCHRAARVAVSAWA